MSVLATLRLQQRTRARTVLGLLIVVWLNLTLQACAVGEQATELSDDRPAAGEVLDSTRDDSSHLPVERCAQKEPSFCDGPVVASTKAEALLPDNSEFKPTAAAAIDDVVAAVPPPTVPPLRPAYPVVAAAVPLTIQYCVYQI